MTNTILTVLRLPAKRRVLFSLCIYLLFVLPAAAQQSSSKPLNTKTQKHMPVNIEKLTNPTVRSAIEALGKGDTKEWLSFFTSDVQLYDDGKKIDFSNFTKSALGHEHFTSIDKVENNGLDIYGHFHSDQWGDFKTYFKVRINKDGKIERLDIGQANY